MLAGGVRDEGRGARDEITPLTPRPSNPAAGRIGIARNPPFPVQPPNPKSEMQNSMPSPVSVILIGQRAGQFTGQGCHAAVEQHDPPEAGWDLLHKMKEHPGNLPAPDPAVGQLLPPADAEYQVSVVAVDPRHQLRLIPKLLGDVFRYRPGWRAGLKTALQFFSLPAVVVNGRVISRSGEPIHPDTLRRIISGLLPRESESTEGATE